MNRTGVLAYILAGVSLLGGCASAGPSPLPMGPQAYEAIPQHVDQSTISEAIRPGDRISIRIFGEPELSGDAYVVDAAGYIQMPLLGEVIAAGQTPRQLTAELRRRFGAHYLREPSITLTVIERTSDTFTVEGEVNSPGVFTATPSTTLLSALAQSKSPTKTAKTDDIIIFRYINGQRAGGRFNLTDVRRGRAPDPQILGGDTIVVVNSAAKSAWRDVLGAIPLLNTFLLLRN